MVRYCVKGNVFVIEWLEHPVEQWLYSNRSKVIWNIDCTNYRLNEIRKSLQTHKNFKIIVKKLICTFGGSISSQYCPADRPSCSASTYSCSCLSLSSIAYPCMLVESCEDSNRRNSCNPDHTQTAARAEFDTIAPYNVAKACQKHEVYHWWKL